MLLKNWLTDVKANFVISILISIANLFWVSWHLFTFVNLTGNYNAEVNRDFTISFLHVRVAISLVLGTFCLLIFKKVGIYVAAVCNLWVLFEYYFWYLWTENIKMVADIQNIPVTSAYNLFYGVNNWNLAVLLVVFWLLIHEITCITQNITKNIKYR